MKFGVITVLSLTCMIVGKINNKEYVTLDKFTHLNMDATKK